MIYLFDRQENLIKIVRKTAIKTALQRYALTTDNYVSDRLTVEMRALDDSLLEAVGFMAIQSMENSHNYHYFYVVQKETKGDLTHLVGVQSGIEELMKSMVYDKRPKNKKAYDVIKDLLAETNWRLRFVSLTKPSSTTFYYLSVFEALKKVCAVWGLEMQFFVQMNGNRIGGRYLDFKQKIGKATGERVVYGHNALEIIKESDHSQLFTALIGRGKGEEIAPEVTQANREARLAKSKDEQGDASPLTPQGVGYGRKITFEDVVWSRANRQPVDKPAGQKYVELPKQTALYGIKNSDGTMRPKIGVIEFSDEEDKERLLERTYEALVTSSRPQVSFQTTTAYLKGVGIGDTIRVVRHDKQIDYETRVYEITYNRLNNQSSDIKLGDRPSGQDTRAGQIQTAAMQAVEGFIEETFKPFVLKLPDFLPSADGFSTNWYGEEDPVKKYPGKVLINDIWYKPDPEHEGHTIMQRWTGEAWAEILRTADNEVVKRSIDRQLQELTRVKSEQEALVRRNQEELGNFRQEVAALGNRDLLADFEKPERLEQVVERLGRSESFQKLVDRPDLSEQFERLSGDVGRVNDHFDRMTDDVDRLSQEIGGVRETSRLNAQLIGHDGVTRYNKNLLKGGTARRQGFEEEPVALLVNDGGFKAGETYTISFASLCRLMDKVKLTILPARPRHAVTYRLTPRNGKLPVVETAKNQLSLHPSHYQVQVISDWYRQEGVEVSLLEPDNQIELALNYRQIADGNEDKLTGSWQETAEFIFDGNG